MPRESSFLRLPAVLIIVLLLAVLSVQHDTAVVMIRDSRGERVGIEDAFRKHREVMGEKRSSDGESIRLSKCLRCDEESAVIEKLETTGIQIVHAGSLECPTSHEGICNFVKSLKPDLNYTVAACTDGLEPSSFRMSSAGADASMVGAEASLRAYCSVLKYPPNDPLFSEQRDYFRALGIRQTWKAVRRSGLPRKDVVVAILDSGITPGHPEFEGKVLEGHDASGTWRKSVVDHFGHGTAMAGIIASNINNGFGIAGIADKVLVRPIRMSEKGTEAAFERVVRAWEAALMFADTDIILYSAGGWFDQDRSIFYKLVLEKAVKNGILVLTAAPNSDNVDGPEEVELPCALAHGVSGVLCIAATVTSDPLTALGDATKLASLGMPGTNVTYPTPIRDGDVWRYAKGQGSSVAAAAAAGIVVLMKSFKNFTPMKIERILLNSTEGRVRTKAGDEMSYGLLRPDVAIKQAIAEAMWSQIA
ncbi:hypothetical protein FOZ61_009686 [Perkinsus olseni]|uniref:subtilisin n=1 Tax=Perkinsus olseni TaxID=32597 RepID=A0A7J6L0V8_PEROL|nr:hypothetical protein FOZ61_009686 [Perkinsus olseni]KAF4663519.1 hypothetical protein FOL46_004711 [Perkinsus olseni]